jgi:carboxypeptidase family protein
MTSRGHLLALALVLGLLPATASAQIGVSTDIITGRVLGEDDRPLAGAVVEALSLETQITRTVRTDVAGRFTIVFPDGGGQYRMTAKYIGMQPRTETIQRYADEDRLVWNVKLSTQAILLDAVTVNAPPRPVRVPDPPTPGSADRAFNPDQTARLPIDVSDLNLLATLVPGVLAVPATDSTAAGFSVAGQRPEGNAATLDGARTSSASVPQDAIRNTRVITSTYDVARGDFTGGLVATTTRSGTNRIQGSSSYSLRDDALEFPRNDDSPFSQGYTQHQLSGGLGGPLVRNRLFLFGSLQGRFRWDPQQTLLSATATDLSRLGVHPDSVARFLAAVQGVGVSPTLVAADPDRTDDNLSGLLRLDYLISDAHTFTLRGDLRGASQEPARLSAMSLPQTGGVSENSGDGIMATLTSRFGTQVVNEARVYRSTSRSDANPYVILPEGRVLVASTLPDGSQGVASLVFGGGVSMPTRSRSTSLEAVNELSWLPGAGGHRWKLGGLFRSERSNDVFAAYTLGSFTYNSIADLEAGSPALFRRTLVPRARQSWGLSYALYGADVWRTSPAVQLTYGVRLEGSTFRRPPAFNPAIDSLFGRRTDRLPSEWHVSPRVGFTWTIGGQSGQPAVPAGAAGAGGGQIVMRGPPAFIVRGGLGEFRSPISTGLVASAYSATGLASSEAQVVCIGSQIPTPDWTAYAADPTSIPTSCSSGGPPVQGAAPNVTVFGDGFGAPRAWRASLGVQRNLTQLLRLSVDLSYARGLSQAGFRDLNLVGSPTFGLSAEGGRPVYVPSGDIDSATGAVRFTGSRVDSTLGQVLEIGSGLHSDSKQLTVSFAGLTGRGVMVQVSYTLANSRDQAMGIRGGFGSGGSTAGNPNTVEWAASDFQRSHSFLATVTRPFGPAIELTGIARLTSGSPYTPMVGSDVNGDGARNDRAFIFQPGSSTPEEQGMGNLLAAAPGRTRDCLARQVGRVADRNSCRGPWQGTLDLQFNYRPAFLGLNRRLVISVVTVNLLRGIDELVHGSDNAKGWGLTLRPDPTLLYVTGFDAAAQRFSYVVNERFGATGSGANALRSPFQIGIQMRFTIGPDRAQEALMMLRGGAGFAPGGRAGPGAGGGDGPRVIMGGPGGAGGGGPAAMLSRLDSLLPNPAGVVLNLKDSLALTAEQVTRLEVVRDTLNAHNAALGDSLRKEIENEGANPDPARLMGIARPRLETLRNNMRQAWAQVRGVLTEEQWGKLPERYRNPQGVQRRP